MGEEGSNNNLFSIDILCNMRKQEKGQVGRSGGDKSRYVGFGDGHKLAQWRFMILCGFQYPQTMLNYFLKMKQFVVHSIFTHI